MLRSCCVVGSAMGYVANPAPCVQWSALGLVCPHCARLLVRALGAASIERVSRLCMRTLASAFVVCCLDLRHWQQCALASLKARVRLALGSKPIASRFAGSTGSAAKESSVIAAHIYLFRHTLATCSASVCQVLLNSSFFRRSDDVRRRCLLSYALVKSILVFYMDVR